MTLFSKSKGGAEERKKLNELLAFIVNGTRGPAGYANVPNALAEKIEKLEPGLIQPKSGATIDPAGNIAVYATSKGVAAILGDDVAATEQESSSEFALESGFAVPPSKRGGVKADIYPFAKMAVGQSFFIPATEDRPNPTKAMASTVSSANKRNASVFPAGHAQAGQPTGKDGRKFTVRARVAGQDGEKANGARVYRVA